MKIIIAITCLMLISLGATKAAFIEKETTIISTEQAQFIIYLDALANLRYKDYEHLTGRHLSLTQRVFFGMNRRHLQKQLKRYQETYVLPSKILSLYLASKKKSGSNMGRTIAIVLLIILLLFLIGFLVLLGNWK